MLEIFRLHWKPGVESFEFPREEIREIAISLGLRPPDNLGDFVYSFRFRNKMPSEIRDATPPGKSWIIKMAGRASYRVELASFSRILPREDMQAIKLPDSTPEIIRLYAKGDEQAVLARVRYNRLIDIFLGITSYSLQNHLRTSVLGIGQIEVDELYVGLNREGTHFIVPVQAKVKDDQHSVVQTLQDLAMCKQKFPKLVARAVSAQYLAASETMVMFELVEEEGEVKIRTERHYKLVSGSDITDADLNLYQL